MKHLLCGFLLAVMLIVPYPGWSQSYTFQVFAGAGGTAGTVDGIGNAVRFAQPYAIAIDNLGNVYVSDYNRVIRKVAPNGLTTTLAGMAGVPGYSDGRRSDARFFNVVGLAADGDGNLYVGDRGNNAIRKVTPGGTVSTIADYFDGLNYPEGVAIDPSGNLLVANTSDHEILQVTPGGAVTSVAGTGVSGYANGPAAAAQFKNPAGVAVDAAGAIYISDRGNYVIRKITSGTVTKLAGTPGVYGSTDGPGTSAKFISPGGIAVDSSGFVYVADAGNLRKIAPDGTVTTIAETFNVVDVTLDRRNGDLYLTDSGQNTIRRLSGGVFTVFAGQTVPEGSADGTGTGALFRWPFDLASDPAGNIYAVERWGNKIRKITPAGVASTLAGGGSNGYQDGQGTEAHFNNPEGIGVDSSSNVYVADTENHVIRKITPGGLVTTIAGSPGTPGAADGLALTEARFDHPVDVACDGAGNLYVADSGNHTIRKISGGVVSTLAGSAGQPGFVNATGPDARFYSPRNIVVDALGYIEVVDDNDAVRRVTTGGVVTTLAGSGVPGYADGLGAAATFDTPRGIASDAAGNLYIGDSSNCLVRKVTPAGQVTTIGGIPLFIGHMDGTGTAARFQQPTGTAVDPSGRIYGADSSAHTIRRGTIALDDRATINNATGQPQVQFQLGTSPSAATSWQWSIIRRPAGSMAELSNSSIRNPTFVPDASDRYVFSLKASDGASTSISEVTLTVLCPPIAISPTILPSASRMNEYATRMIARGGLPPHWFQQISGSVPAGLVFDSGGTLSGVVAASAATGDYTFGIRAGDQCDCLAEAGILLTVSPLSVPTNLVATALSATSIQLQWDRFPSATYYEVYRRSSSSSGFGYVGNAAQPASGQPSFIDSVTPNAAYLYIVYAVVGSTMSGASQPDLATTVLFTDPTLTAGMVIKKEHISELRTAVTAVRSLAALTTGAFTDPVLSPSVVVKRTHVIELRGSLDAARAMLALPVLKYTNFTITPGVTVIRAVHINELRGGLQ